MAIILQKARRISLLSLTLILGSCLSWSQSTPARGFLCNATNLDLRYAIKTYDSGHPWVSGWIALPSAQCVWAATISEPGSEAHFYFVAHTLDENIEWVGDWHDPDSIFCIDSNGAPFGFPPSGCGVTGRTKVPFRRVDVNFSTGSYYTITCENATQNFFFDCGSVNFSIPVNGKLAPPPPPSPPAKPLWQTHIDWCSNNRDAGGSVDCPELYLGTYPACMVSGGRSCLISKAKALAHSGNCDDALRVTLICQCKNQEAKDAIEAAGARQVCGYLGPPPTDSGPGSGAPPRPQTGATQPYRPYYVIWRWTCTDNEGDPAGDHTVTMSSSRSCEDAERQLQLIVNACGPGKRTSITHEDKTGDGPCMAQ
jgi:uncharacterized membrane protein